MIGWDGTPRALEIGDGDGLVARIGSVGDSDSVWGLLASSRESMRSPSMFPIASKRGLAEELETSESFMVLVEEGDDLAAVAVCRRPEVAEKAIPELAVVCVHERRYSDALLLDAMAVRKDMRRRGIGRAVMSLVADAAAAEGRVLLSACVSPRNHPATTLMRACGFHGLAAIRSHRHGGAGRLESTLVMVKRIDR